MMMILLLFLQKQNLVRHPIERLGVKQNASYAEIIRAYYQLLNKLHGVDVEVTPLKDFVGQCDDLDEAVLRPIEDARQTLTDKAKRREYDRQLTAL